MDPTGAYTADRASALSGVPLSTVYWWERHNILHPSVSRDRVKLWSYSDLMSLRVIYWLRGRKTTKSGAEIPRTSMKLVRKALLKLRELDLPLFSEQQSTIRVDADGNVHLVTANRSEDLRGQTGNPDLLDLIAPFTTNEGLHGPDLARPRPLLRIVPGKLSGSPHVMHTRVETRALFALQCDGLDATAIHSLYPYLTGPQIAEALDLEQQLQKNVETRTAA